jgi:hypothetical protein
VLDYKIFDFGTSAININDSTVNNGENQYVVGSQFSDTFTGENNVNNLYYFIGATGGANPTDTFTGGTGGWNIAVFGDSRSDYTISTQVESGPNQTTIASNGDDPAHTGSLTVTNVEILAFDPAADPTPSNGTIDVSGGTYVILGGNNPITIAAGATAEIDSAASGETSYTGSVTFEAAAGTLVLDQPGDFAGTVSGISGSGDVLDLIGYNTDTTVTDGTYSGGDTIITVTDSGQTTLSITLAGNYSSSTWTVTTDASDTGVDIYDPPAAADATIAAGASLDLSTPSSENVTFAGGTGALVLNDPESFSGQIIDFTGTAPNAAHSDTVDLVGINYDSSQFADTYNSATGLLTVTDGTHSASITFDDFNATLDFASDGDGGTLITDPPSTGSASEPSVLSTVASTATADGVSGDIALADSDAASGLSAGFTPDGSNYLGSFSLDTPTESNGNVSVGFEFMAPNDQINLAPGETLTQSYNVTVADAQNPAENLNQTISVTIGGPGNDNFVFAPGIGADTITNFNPQHDTIELDHFAAAQTVQELQSLITTDVHGDAVINLGHNDSITVAGVNVPELQQIIQAGHVLLH